MDDPDSDHDQPTIVVRPLHSCSCWRNESYCRAAAATTFDDSVAWTCIDDPEAAKDTRYFQKCGMFALTTSTTSGPGFEASSNDVKCVSFSTMKQCTDYATNMPGGPRTVEVGAWGEEFPKACSGSKVGADVHGWWNNNAGDDDSARNPSGEAYAEGSCCQDSSRRTCCGNDFLFAPLPTPKKSPYDNTEPPVLEDIGKKTSLRPNVANAEVSRGRPMPSLASAARSGTHISKPVMVQMLESTPMEFFGWSVAPQSGSNRTSTATALEVEQPPLCIKLH